MKKIIIVMLLLLPGILFSQTQFGLKGGLNFANIVGDSEGLETKLGFHAGFFIYARPSEQFAIMPECVFSRQGAQASANNKFKVNYDYLNFPVMFNLYPTSDNFFFQAGPQLGLLLNAKVTDGNQSEDVKDQLNVVDFSLGLGMGAEINTVIFSARYNLGLTDTSQESGNTKYPNSVIQVSVAFKFE